MSEDRLVIFSRLRDAPFLDGAGNGLRSVLLATSVALAALTLSGCDSVTEFLDDSKPPLPGERISILSSDESIMPDAEAKGFDIRLPRPQINSDWPQAGGNSFHVMGHLAAPGALQPIWEVSAGDGSTAELRLISSPIVADGMIFTIDVDSMITAFDLASGDEIWDVEIADETEDDDTFLGGGLAYADGMIFATTGFAEIVALDSKTGDEAWRVKVAGPMRAPPTVADGRLYAVTIDNQLFAIDAKAGKKLWSHVGAIEAAGLLGGASPAVHRGVVVVPYSSGEIHALRAVNGRPLWSDTLGALKKLDMVSSLADIRARPVIDGSRVFVVGHGGRMVALDLRTGLRVWERSIGGIQSPWVAGDFLYVLTGDSKIVCLSKKEGTVLWVGKLNKYEDQEDKEDRIVWAGPVLAGNRLIVVGTNEEALAISPYTGDLLGRMEMPAAINVAPIVVGGVVYFLTDDAELIALR